MGKPLAALALLSAAFCNHPGVGVLRVASAVQDGETVSISPWVFEVDYTPVASIVSGRVRVDLSAAPTLAAASKILTLSGNAVAAETVSVGGVTYTWRAAVTTTANEVKVGADAAASIVNLLAAIAATPASAGVLYGSLTVVNPQVTAVGDATTVTATAILKGTVGNAIVIGEAMTNGAWAGGATTLAGGVDATAGEFTTALKAAIDAGDYGVQAVRVSANEVLVSSTRQSMAHAATTETLAGSNNAWAAATLVGAGPGGEETLPIVMLVKRAATAVEVALGAMHFMFAFAPSLATVVVTTAAGVPKAFDGVATITGNRVTVDISGSSDWASTDLVYVQAAK